MRRLSRDLAAQMILPTGDNSLGLETGGTGHSSWFARHGGNADSGASIIGFVHSGQGAVVLATGDGHAGLINEVMAGLSKLYFWPAMPTLQVDGASADGAATDDSTGGVAPGTATEGAPNEESSAS